VTPSRPAVFGKFAGLVVENLKTFATVQEAKYLLIIFQINIQILMSVYDRFDAILVDRKLPKPHFSDTFDVLRSQLEVLDSIINELNGKQKSITEHIKLIQERDCCRQMAQKLKHELDSINCSSSVDEFELSPKIMDLVANRNKVKSEIEILSNNLEARQLLSMLKSYIDIKDVSKAGEVVKKLDGISNISEPLCKQIISLRKTLVQLVKDELSKK
jgi:hypothetical protein